MGLHPHWLEVASSRLCVLRLAHLFSVQVADGLLFSSPWEGLWQLVCNVLLNHASPALLLNPNVVTFKLVYVCCGISYMHWRR
jgi:hypothetical protein